MRPKLCVTVTGSTMTDLRRQRDEVIYADLVELRLDGVRGASAAGALNGRRLPAIVTCRPTWEGGRFDGSEEERARLLREALELGAEYIDVEWRAELHGLQQGRQGRGIVVSMHDFEGVPADLGDRVRAMRATGAEVVKVAAMTHRLSDCLPLMEIGRAAEGPTVVVAMGDAGLASRIVPARFNSYWTYAGNGVAPGQLPASRLRDQFSFDHIDEHTAIYGVVGRPIVHSLSPVMHNAAFRALGLNAVYLPLAAQDYDDFLAFAGAMDVVGASVTAPFKLDAYARADRCDPISTRIEAANTVRRVGDQWEACNTDVAGFLAPLQARIELHGAVALILGAGGAARGVAEALISAGAEVMIAARQSQQAQTVAALVGARVADWPPRSVRWDVLVNSTPVGSAPDTAKTPLPDGPFAGTLVYDLVYNPEDTRLLRDAKHAGCQVIGGLEMLVAQAERQFEWWTGHRPPAGVMKHAALSALGSSR